MAASGHFAVGWRNWSVPKDRIEKSELHRLIVRLDFPVIYTTNYDRNLEPAYEIYGRDYVKVANARDVAQAAKALPTSSSSMVISTRIRPSS